MQSKTKYRALQCKTVSDSSQSKYRALQCKTRHDTGPYSVRQSQTAVQIQVQSNTIQNQYRAKQCSTNPNPECCNARQSQMALNPNTERCNTRQPNRGPYNATVSDRSQYKYRATRCNTKPKDRAILSWFNPSQQPSTTQPLPHSPSPAPCSQWDGEESQERRQNSWVERRAV